MKIILTLLVASFSMLPLGCRTDSNPPEGPMCQPMVSEIEMRDFLRMIEKISGTRIQFPTNQVNGVRFKAEDYQLEGLSWREALDVVLKDHQFEAAVDSADTNLIHVIRK